MMNREDFEELQVEEAEGIEEGAHPGGERLDRLAREEAEGIEVYDDPYEELLTEQELEEAEGSEWIPEHEAKPSPQPRRRHPLVPLLVLIGLLVVAIGLVRRLRRRR
jgi:hypothetical protein